MLHGCYRGVTRIYICLYIVTLGKVESVSEFLWRIKRTLNDQYGNTVSARIFVMLHEIGKKLSQTTKNLAL